MQNVNFFLKSTYSTGFGHTSQNTTLSTGKQLAACLSHDSEPSRASLGISETGFSQTPTLRNRAKEKSNHTCCLTTAHVARQSCAFQ